MVKVSGSFKMQCALLQPLEGLGFRVAEQAVAF